MAIDWDRRADGWIDLLRECPRDSAVALLAMYLAGAEVEGALNTLQEIRADVFPIGAA